MRQSAGAARPVTSSIHVVFTRGEKFLVAECLEVPVVTQGRTLDELAANLKEAVALHLEGEDLNELGIGPNPRLVITYEISALGDA